MSFQYTHTYMCVCVCVCSLRVSLLFCTDMLFVLASTQIHTTHSPLSVFTHAPLLCIVNQTLTAISHSSSFHSRRHSSHSNFFLLSALYSPSLPLNYHFSLSLHTHTHTLYIYIHTLFLLLLLELSDI